MQHLRKGAESLHNAFMPRIDIYKRAYCQNVLELMTSGAALCEVAAHLKVDMATIRRWQDEHPSFARAVEKGETLAESWWSAQGREGLYDKNFKVSLWATYMKSRFGWGSSLPSEIPSSSAVEASDMPAAVLKWQESN
ncbi:MAG: hypothetical protein OSB62_06950 [Alphaproteobacteria bacterium]|nr:hypothetical protein [Alphaproteobacteria bacterium]